MFLSKVMLFGKFNRNLYEIHRALWQMFPKDADAERDFLFRIERPGYRQSEILMQSIRQPTSQKTNIKLIATRNYDLSLKDEQRLRFLLVANPVKKINDEKGRENTKGEIKKCRVPLFAEAQQRLWIERKLEHNAQLEALVITSNPPFYFRKTGVTKAGKIQPVSFQGTLKVKKPNVLKEMIAKGIGPAKAFGCGLMSVARA
ncbi:MAG: type I-E CRISPR-associated protein Cas6/Cse3/CasE [Thermodesulfobacteriota bacterium]|nr:type I-E CRISPR-associated protein Cas6/Cse3/CasE [Thermodesulfobacteriota bacterium]